HSQAPLPIWVNDCLSVSNVLYATGNGHLRIYDISAPGQLQELGSAPSSAGIHLALLGSTLFQATYGVGVTLFNVADPRNPKLIATMQNGSSSAVEVAGSNVLATAGGLLVVIDPSDVTKPRVVGETRIDGGGNSIA